MAAANYHPMDLHATIAELAAEISCFLPQPFMLDDIPVYNHADPTPAFLSLFQVLDSSLKVLTDNINGFIGQVIVADNMAEDPGSAETETVVAKTTPSVPPW